MSYAQFAVFDSVWLQPKVDEPPGNRLLELGSCERARPFGGISGGVLDCGLGVTDLTNGRHFGPSTLLSLIPDMIFRFSSVKWVSWPLAIMFMHVVAWATTVTMLIRIYPTERAPSN